MSALQVMNLSPEVKKGFAFSSPPPVSSRKSLSSLIVILLPHPLFLAIASSIWSAKWCTFTITSLMPYCCRYSMFRCSKDLPFTKASAFGCLSVHGLNLVPSPAAKIIACITYSPAEDFASFFPPEQYVSIQFLL